MTTDNNSDASATGDEVARLRQEIADLQSQLAAYHCLEENTIRVAPREERDSLGNDIELIGDFEALQAEGVDISKGGVCLEVGDPLPFDIKMKSAGQEHGLDEVARRRQLSPRVQLRACGHVRRVAARTDRTADSRCAIITGASRT